jgi:hypothetical protein
MNPPTANPIMKNAPRLTSFRYSGERNKKGTPKALPALSKIMANRNNQKKMEIKLYLIWAKSNCNGKKD